jgi:hypothetical protein
VVDATPWRWCIGMEGKGGDPSFAPVWTFACICVSHGLDGRMEKVSLTRPGNAWVRSWIDS